jgi:hypothetical protein
MLAFVGFFLTRGLDRLGRPVPHEEGAEAEDEDDENSRAN